MTPTDRAKVGRAAKLLLKAESTDSHEEAISLALRAYSLVADWLNAHENANGPSRRRDRRLLRDRRSLRFAWRPFAPASAPEAPAGARVVGYHRGGDDGAPRTIDLRA